MTNSKQNQIDLDDAIFMQSQGEFEGPCVSDLSELPEQYRGIALHVNDHGNVTLYRVFKNGNVREIASRV